MTYMPSKLCRDILRNDFGAFVHRAFLELNPASSFEPNWHLEVLAAKLEEVRSRQVQTPDHQYPAAPPQIPCRLYSLYCLAAGSRSCQADPGDQLCAGPVRQARPRLPRADDQRVLSSPLRHAALGGSQCGGRVRDHARRLSALDLCGRRGHGPRCPCDHHRRSHEGRRRALGCQAASREYLVRQYSAQPPKPPGEGAIVVVMQRLHADDLVAHLQETEGWDVLSFPAIAETGRALRDSRRSMGAGPSTANRAKSSTLPW